MTTMKKTNPPLSQVMNIEPSKTWFGQRMKDISEAELVGLFQEISQFRRTGILKGEKLRQLAMDFSENVSHTDYGQNMRLVEDEILFEMSRRYHNSLQVHANPLLPSKV